MKQRKGKLKAVLVGIAGSHNAFSLSLYNLKAYAYRCSSIHNDWEISVIQHPLIGGLNKENLLLKLRDKILSLNPDVVGFSCYMWNIYEFIDIATGIHNISPDTKIIFGGPEIATDYVKEGNFDEFPIDFCVSGEGEHTFLELLSSFSGGLPLLENIAGLSHRTATNTSFTINPKRIPFKSLTEIPSPFLSGVVDEEVLARKNVEANIETQRGCNLRCSYCIYHKDMDRVTYSEVDRILEEVRYILDRGVKKIRFVDANFSSRLPHAKSVMKRLIEEKCQTSLFFELIPGFIDEELASLFGDFTNLHNSNQITIGVGVQTINRKVLKRLKRPIRKEKFEMTFKLLQKYNIYTKIDLIIGLPGEDISAINRTLEYMVEQLRGSRAHLLCCHVMRGLPGTELIDMAKEDNMVFSSKYEPHELIESPTLPRSDMVRCLRRTAVLFRLINHGGWADREFVREKFSDTTNIRDLFFLTRDKLGLKNIGLVDMMVEALVDYLKPRHSYFSEPDFPYAETWWWNHASHEISNDWIVNFLSDLDVRPNTI
jgi:radical SAM superfamily enzyme YgiQ (UPF0313 family)